MHCIGSKLSKNFAWELGFLYKVRNFSDGVDLLRFTVESSWFKGDHNPQYGVQLMVLNHMIFEFKIYNVNHVKDDDE